MYHLPLPVLCQLQRVQSVSSSRPLMEMLCSINSRVTSQVTGLNHASGHNPLSPAVQSVSNPPHCPLIFYIFYQFLCKDVVRDNIESQHRLHPLLSLPPPDHFYALIIGRHNLHFVNQSSLLPNSLFSFMCLEIIHNITFPGSEVTLAALYVLGSSFLPFFKKAVTFVFF